MNPVFATEPEVSYSSPGAQFKFTMWDHDGGADFELIGFIELTISDLLEIADSGQCFEGQLRDLAGNTNRGNIKIYPTRI